MKTGRAPMELEEAELAELAELAEAGMAAAEGV